MLELNYESQGFAVQSDLKFLYQIGRIWAESGKYLEEGMLWLDDYINLINFFYPTETQQSGRIYEMKTKAIYMVGLIFYQVKDYEEWIKYLTEVKDDLLEIDDIEKYYKWEQIIAEINEKKFY